MFKIIISMIVFLSCFISPANAGSFLLEEYNVVTIGDFSANNEADGRVFVGGNLTQTNSHNIGNHLTSFVAPTLQVAGTVVGGNGIQVKGDMTVGSSNTLSTHDNGNKFRVNERDINNVDSVTVDANLSAMAADYKNQLEQASTSFKNLANNSDLTINGNNVNLNVNQNLATNDYAVFNLNFDQIFTNTQNQQIEMFANNLSNLAGVIINVAGINLSLSTGSNMIGNIFTSIAGREKILWNFYEAETLNLNAQNIMGSLLAPLATVTTSGNIDGSVGAFSLLTSGEVHLPNSVVKTPELVEVPEPSSIILFIFAFALLVNNRYKFKR